jgi:hypothetical protein
MLLEILKALIMIKSGHKTSTWSHKSPLLTTIVSKGVCSWPSNTNLSRVGGNQSKSRYDSTLLHGPLSCAVSSSASTSFGDWCTVGPATVSEKDFVSFAGLSEGVWFVVLGLSGDSAAGRP